MSTEFKGIFIKKKTILIFLLLVAIILASVVIYRVLIYDDIIAKIKDASVGMTVQYGNYEQDNVIRNGKEPIDWIILEKTDEKALVISKYALDNMQFYPTEKDTNYAESTIRIWVNSDFINSAFSIKENNRILETEVASEYSIESGLQKGESTNDKLFLLSISEAKMYFSSDSSRGTIATEFANVRGAATPYNGNCWWWLRTMDGDEYAAMISTDGDYSCYNAVSNDAAVRPAMWVNLKP